MPTLLAVWLVPSVGCARPAGPLFPAVDPPRVWPGPPDPARIQFLGILGSSGDLQASQPAGEVLAAAWRGPRPPIGFSAPQAVAIRDPDLLAVADGVGGAVHLIDLARRSHQLMLGWDDQRFATPAGVAWAGQRLFVSDAQRREVIEVDQDGVWRQRFGSERLQRPVGIAYVSSVDQLYVVDGGAHGLVVFGTDGRFIKTIGERGVEPGQFNFPTHLCAIRDRLLVADSGNARVQVLDFEGRCAAVIGQKGDAAGDFSLPKGVAGDSQGHIYVVDAHFENVQVFDESGRLLMTFGEEGHGLGQFSLPSGLAMDRQDRLWIADTGNRRLQVFAYLRVTS